MLMTSSQHFRLLPVMLAGTLSTKHASEKKLVPLAAPGRRRAPL